MMKNLLNQKMILDVFKNNILLIVFLFTLPQNVFADAFQNSWFSATISNCSNQVTIVTGIYFDDANTTNDDMWKNGSYIQMNNGSGWVSLASIGQDEYANSWNWKPNGEWVHITPYTTRNLHSQNIINCCNTSGNDLVSATFIVDLINADVGNTLQFRISGAGWDDGGGTGIHTVTFDRTKDLTSISATDATICFGTKISWNPPNGLCPGTQIEIFRNNFLLTTQNVQNLSFIDITGVQSLVYQYKARLKYSFGVVVNRSNFSSLVDGKAKGLPLSPNNFQVTQENCDGTVDLSWEWTGTNPLNFVLYKNFLALPNLNGNVRSYTDNVTRGIYNYYSIRATNSCGIGAYSSFELGVSPADPYKPTDLNVSEIPGVGVQLSWPAVSNAASYQIERSLLGGGGSSFFDIDTSTLFYLDQSLNQCQTYEYRIRAINGCRPNGVLSDSVVSIRLTPDISNTFNNTALSASKGYFPGRVELTWSLDNNSNNINQFKIYRKILGSTDDSIIIQTLNSGSNIYNDYLATAGVLYKYTIIGEMLCEQNTLYSNAVSSTGFRSPIGTVTGQVNYTGGIAVQNVQVKAESSTGLQGASLQFNGTQSLEINNNSNYNISNGLSLEMWFKPTSHASNFTLVEKNQSYSIKHIGSNYEFRVFTSSTSSQVVSIPDADITLNNFNHFSGVLFNDSLRLYVNGISTNYTLMSGTVNNNNTKLYIASSFSGIIDEFRLWNIGKAQFTVSQDYLRQLNGGEMGLKIYLKLDEATGNYAYDFSNSGVASFNKNHAKFINSPTWSTDIPSSSQLSITGYTNSQGNYILSIPYAGNGQTFVISPSYLTHNFNPSTRAIFVGEGSPIHNNIDFEDISSFTVQGDLFYKNTSCAVKEATLLIDGNIVVSNGQPLKTDATGAFNIQVPIGNHVITIEKNNHNMSIGRFPAMGTYNFQNDLAGIHFKDSTLVKITGRVVGGLREAQYIHGLGKSKNNIGQARIILKSQQGNGCFTDTIITDYITGEYTTFAPPMKYIPSVIIPSNPTINFGVINILDLDVVPIFTTVYDTLSYDTLAQIYLIDSFKFQKQLDFTHRVNPIINIFDFEDASLPFRGDKEFSYESSNGTQVIRDLVANPLPWSLFSKEEYKCYLQVYELYSNLQTNTMDSVPTTDGTINFNNQIAKNPTQYVAMNEVNTLNELNFLVYPFKIASPNFNENTSIPQYSYTKSMEIYLTTGNGTIIQWQPNNFAGTMQPSTYNGTFRGYVLGKESKGTQFLTTGPQVPEYVLRDPPGSNSFASREVGTEKTTENSWAWNTGGVIKAEDQILVGSKFLTGLGVATETSIKANVTVGLTAAVSGGNNGTESVTITNTQQWQTNSINNVPGKNSDVYIGKSKNVSFGISTSLKIVPDSLCSSVNCIGNSFGGLSLATYPGLSIVPGGYATQFIYDENHIKNYLIPLLKNTRNALLQSNAKYSSNLPITDNNYGLNNDNPIIDTTIQELNSDEKVSFLLRLPDSTYFEYDTINGTTEVTKIFINSTNQKTKWDKLKKLTNPDYSVLTGNSYTYNAVTKQDSLTGDSVRWLNNQITHWENSIMLNEWEKVNIGNTTIRNLLKEREFSDLRNKYKSALNKYKELQSASIAATSLVSAAALLTAPGSTYVGAASFAIATGTGIAAAEVNDKVLQYENEKALIEAKYNEQNANYSISGGNTFSSSMSHATASSHTNSIEYGISLNLSTEFETVISNTGFAQKKSISLDFQSSKDWSTITSSTENVSFTLNDPDQGDYFSVDVFPSLLGWGPIFKLQAGGQTKCPHEDAQLTEYYKEDPNNLNSNNLNSPFYELSAKTLQIEKPTITSAPSILTNIPITSSAVFNLTINNESENNDEVIYAVELVASSNPFGAIVAIDGFSPFVDVSIPGGSSINKVLTVQKGPGPTYDYDSLLIIVHSKCQYAAGTSDNEDIVDSTYVSAHFLPTCTDVNFSIPNDQWVLNNSFHDSMPIAIIDYDINFFDFNKIRLDYKPTSQSQWIGLKTFFKDTIGLQGETQIPTNTPFTLWDWETDQIVDGNYDLRLVTQCTLADNISLTHTGVMDRINPHPFGTPSPADGILDPNEDITIRFNEPIDLGSITSLNFDVRGVLNGTETNHYSNLYFNGIDNNVEITAGIPVQNRDFTIEFSVKRAGIGEEVIISQGSDVNEQIYIGFNNADQLVFKINGQFVTSTNTFADTDWHYFAVAYNNANETLEMYEASGSSTASLINNGNISIYPKYVGLDKLYIGYSAANNSFFNGNIDDVRIWNTTRTLAEFSVNKTLLLGSNELGLLYNWRFDEANGMFVEDHVRSRNGIIHGAEWTVEPSGNAISFDGIDDYLRIDKGNVNITKEMDFTLEFWFNSTQTGVATLVSNGTGTGLSSDSLYSWNIAKDASGKIHVNHNGIDFVAVDNNYFNGEWHHFALVMNRLGNLTAYIDGNLENATQALPFIDFGGSAMYLGARGYYVGTIENYDNYFDGKMDEFRFWNASRKYEQLNRDKQNRMKGDEFALKLYLPFENFALDPTNIPILTASTTEQIDSTNHLVINPNGALLISTTPKIKLQRPVQSIAFTYSVNNDEIIITPTTSSEIIENVTLDITVKNIKDLHGNKMQSPKTWIAYVDKNQVVWQDDVFTLDKDYQATLNISTAIVNNGGSVKTYSINNIPSWLTVTPTSGTILPNSTLSVSIDVDPLLNIGDYSQDLQLLTDFGFPEKLSINLKVREQEPNWIVNPANFINSMSIIGYLKINDVVSANAEDMLSVFVNNECRGVAHLEYVPLLDRYLVFLDVYSNLNSGETLEFKVWDASSGTIYSQITPSNLMFTSNDLIGSINNPQLFETSYEIAVEIPLTAGWNWVSDFLLNTDSLDLDITLESINAVTGDEIKGQTQFSNYLDGTGWVGSLNNIGIKPEAGYKLKVTAADTLVLKGDIIDPVTRTISLVQGWNWIGFISIRNQNIDDALGNLNPSDGDIVKAKSQFAVYNTLLGWVGSLQTFIPGNAYMYKSATNTSFVYPASGQFKFGIINQENLYTNKQWVVNNHQYASNMTIISSLDTDCEYILNNKNIVIGVFDEEANCRAVNEIEFLEEDNFGFLTIGGDINTRLKFSILDNTNGRSYDLEESIQFSTNSHSGAIDNPFLLKISDEICFKMSFEKIVDEEGNSEIVKEFESEDLIKVYPTIIENEISLYQLSKNENKTTKVALYNVWGQKIFEKEFITNNGFNKNVFKLNKLNLATGIYHFIIEENEEVYSFKLLKK